MRTRREVVGLALGLAAAPALAEAGTKAPRFEEYVTNTLGTVSTSLSDQAQALEDIKVHLETLTSELDRTETLLGNTRLLDALQAALTELSTSCRVDRA